MFPEEARAAKNILVSLLFRLGSADNGSESLAEGGEIRRIHYAGRPRQVDLNRVGPFLQPVSDLSHRPAGLDRSRRGAKSRCQFGTEVEQFLGPLEQRRNIQGTVPGQHEWWRNGVATVSGLQLLGPTAPLGREILKLGQTCGDLHR